MATDLERLVVTLEARTKEYERQLARAQQVTVGQLRRIEGAVTTSGRNIETRFASIARGVGRTLGAIGVGVTFGALTVGISNAITELADLGEAAQAAGLSVEKLQELQFAGLQVGLSTEQIVTAIGAFNDRLQEAVRNGGDLYDILTRNSVAIQDNNGNMRDTAELLGEVANLIQGAASEQERLNLAGEAFGSRIGRRLVPLLSEGEEGLRRWADAAREAGFVVEEGIINAVDRAADKWTTFWATLRKEAAATAGALIAMAQGQDISPDVTRAKLLQEQVDKINEILVLEQQLSNALSAGGVVAAETLTAALAKAREELQGIVGQINEIEGKSPLEIDVRATLPSVTRGVEAAAASPEVQRIADAILAGFAKQEAEVQAIQRVLQQGNVSAAQRAILMERLAALQATLNGTVSKDSTLRAVGGQIAGAVAQIPVANQSIVGGVQGAVAGLESAIGASGEGVAGAVQQGSGQVSGAVNAMGEKVAQAVQQQATGFSTTVGVASTPQMNAIRQQQSKLQAELTSLQTSLQYKQLSDVEQRQAELRIAEIQIELAKLGEEMVAAEEGLRRVGEALIFLSSRSLLSAERLYQMAYRLAGLEAPALPTARTRGFSSGVRSVPGGFGGGDRVPALLEPGERVFDKHTARANQSLLDAVESGQLRRMSDGGLVARLNSSVQRLQSGGIVQRMPESMATNRDGGGKTTNISISLTGTDLQSIRGSERAMARKFAREIAYELEQL